MTKAEKLTVSFSGIAVLISILSPVVTYRWLDPRVKEFSERARLAVTGEDLFSGDSPDPVKDQYGNVARPSFFALHITNEGKWPAKAVTITCHFTWSPPGTQQNFFSIDPPQPFDLTDQIHDSIIVLKEPIPSETSIKLLFELIPSSIVVSDEFGENTTIVPAYADPSGWTTDATDSGHYAPRHKTH